MTDPLTASAAALRRVQEDAAHEKILLRVDIGERWERLNVQEIIDFRNSDDLVAELVAKYGLARDIAERDAAAVVRGRAF